MAPAFLALDEVLEIHRNQIANYGGSYGMRDRALLESALMQPIASFGGRYLHDDLAHMAAAYAFHVIMNHPFVDGNKRTGTTAALVFLELNGIDFQADPDELAEVMLRVASSDFRKSELADYIRSRCHELPALEASKDWEIDPTESPDNFPL